MSGGWRGNRNGGGCPGYRGGHRVRSGNGAASGCFQVAWNVPVPLVSLVFAGSTAAVSVLVKCTVPE